MIGIVKIFMLQVADAYRPTRDTIRYPAHNLRDWGIEQDFEAWLMAHPELLTDDPQQADWHYLPVYWTRYHVFNDYGKHGLRELACEVRSRVPAPRRTFTICQYADGPLVDTGAMRVYLASRGNGGEDAPLLCARHRKPWFKPRKKYLASFAGRYFTHPVRAELHRLLAHRPDMRFYDGNRGPKYFVKQMLASYAALCPRGHGGDSFRFYEAMQLGVVPLLVGDVDPRPFKHLIDWDKVSLYARTPGEAVELLDSMHPADLLRMGRAAERVYDRDLAFGKWCRHVITELDMSPPEPEAGAV